MSSASPLGRTLAASLVLVVLSVGCSPDSTPGEQAAPRSAVLPAAAPEHPVGELHVAVRALPERWDPALVTSASQAQLIQQVLEPLIRQEADGTAFGRGLAYSWNHDQAALTFSIRLHPEARFSSGDPVTAADVAFSVGDWQTGPLHGDAFDVIERTTIVDDHRLVFHLREPAPHLERLLSQPAAAVYPANYGDRTRAEFLSRPLGAGPYRFSTWQPETELVLVVNPVHHRSTPPTYSTIVATAIPDAADRLSAFRDGTIDLLAIPSWHIADLPDPDVVRAAPHRLSFVGLRRGSGIDTGDARPGLEAVLDHAALADLGDGTMSVPYGVRSGTEDAVGRKALTAFDGAELIFDASNQDHRVLAESLHASLSARGPALTLVGLDTAALERRRADGAYDLVLLTTDALGTRSDLGDDVELVPLVAHRAAFGRQTYLEGFEPTPAGTWWFDDLTRRDSASEE